MVRQNVRISAALAAPALLVACAALAADFEKPRSFQANLIPGISAGGQNYTIKNPVTSDGFMRIYVFTTPWGEFSAIGDGLMRTRQFELAALRELEKITNSDSFNKALADAGMSPIKFAGDLVVNPLGTLGNTIAGALGGGVGGQILNSLLGVGGAAAASGLDIGTIVSAFLTGGVSGGLTALVVGFLKSKLAG